MKIKQAARNYAEDYLRAMGVFYLVMALLFAVTLILKQMVDVQNISISSMEMSSMIFLFVMGLNSFKTQFRLFVQNGITRRTLLWGFLCSAAGMCLAMALIDSLFPLFFRSSLQYATNYELLYGRPATFGAHLTSIVWHVATNCMAVCFGFLLTTLYYRMNKVLKLIVSIGVPCLLFIVLPVAGGMWLLTAITNAVVWILGGTSLGMTAPWRSVILFLLGSGVLAGLGFLLIRRATLKDA